MALPAEDRRDCFTYVDYLAWPEDERWELIDGQAWAMTPAPLMEHQAASGEMFRQIANHLAETGGPCRVFAAPFDVRLAAAGGADEMVDTVVQPDLVVICDAGKLDRRGCLGAPDWVIEILSPHTALRDLQDKRALYERAGVGEYWIVDPANGVVTVLRPDAAGRYVEAGLYGPGSLVRPVVLPELAVDLGRVFAMAGILPPTPRPSPGA